MPPFELPLLLLNEGDEMFVTQHPAAPGLWLPVPFLSLSDGSRCLHIGGRADPKVTVARLRAAGPGLRLLELVRLEDAQLARAEPPERADRVTHPVLVGHDGEATP